MYADQIEAQAHRSVQDRLQGSSAAGQGRRRPFSGKRQREDNDKWEHDLFEGNGHQGSNLKVGAKDLRLKLQRKSMKQSGRGSVLGGARDLREKLSGALYSRLVESKPPAVRQKTTHEANKPLKKRVTTQALSEETKAAISVSKKKFQQKVDSVESFLHSLGIEKYSITFQAEEVDMAALVHMSDEDLKAIGIPMGPRKKILLALESKRDD